MKVWVKFGERFLEVEATPEGEGYRCQVESRPACQVTLCPLGPPGLFLALIDGRPQVVLLEAHGEEVRVHDGRGVYTLYLSRVPPSLRMGRVARASGPLYLRAPMTGLLAEVLKKPGDRVEEGETLAIVEAMKMRNQIKVPISGVLRELRASTGAQVDHGQVIAVIEPR